MTAGTPVSAADGCTPAELRPRAESQPRMVLHVLNSPSGGAALSTLELARACVDRGIRSCAVSMPGGSAEERDALRETFEGRVLFTPLYWSNRKIRTARWKRPISEIKQWWRTGFARRSAALVADYAVRQSADLVHTNTIVTPEGAKAARQLGLPHVWHLRELIGPGKHIRFWREGPALGAYWSRMCDRLVANSPVTAAAVEKWVPADLLCVVPNGIDVGRFEPRSRASSRERLVIGMVANLNSKTKNHHLFVRAAELVERSLPVQFRIYGHDPAAAGTASSGSYAASVHAAVRAAGLEPRFEFAGYCADPAEIMQQIDILVHPVAIESYGRVVAEAMAAGLPVVGARGGGVGYLVQDQVTGLLIEPGDATALSQAITRLCTDATLRHLYGEAGRRRAVEHFSLAAHADKMIEVYRAAYLRHAAARRGQAI